MTAILKNFIAANEEGAKIPKGEACTYIAREVLEHNPFCPVPFESIKSYTGRRWNELLENIRGPGDGTELAERQRRAEENWSTARPITR